MPVILQRGHGRRHRRPHPRANRPAQARNHQWKSEAIFGHALSTIVGLIASTHQARGQDPFETHPVAITVSVLALLLCFCSSIAAPSIPRLSIKTVVCTLARTSVFFGAFALALLGSVSLRSKLGGLAYFFCGFPLLLLMVKTFRWLLKWAYRATVGAILKALSALGSLTHTEPIVVDNNPIELPV
uniref:Uncharacterized protein n=1 Tax=Nelumbo nucifera TaxID=4432 RepID=A0A822ZRW4_NELNU|nr:TPA_asm: hypothetical protein HUJ06_017554 [Nelumbo nucifera]